MSSSTESPLRPLSQIEILEFIMGLEKEFRCSLISFWEYESSFIQVTIARWNENGRGGYEELKKLSFKR